MMPTQKQIYWAIKQMSPVAAKFFPIDGSEWHMSNAPARQLRDTMKTLRGNLKRRSEGSIVDKQPNLYRAKLAQKVVDRLNSMTGLKSAMFDYSLEVKSGSVSIMYGAKSSTRKVVARLYSGFKLMPCHDAGNFIYRAEPAEQFDCGRLYIVAVIRKDGSMREQLGCILKGENEIRLLECRALGSAEQAVRKLFVENFMLKAEAAFAGS